MRIVGVARCIGWISGNGLDVCGGLAGAGDRHHVGGGVGAGGGEGTQAGGGELVSRAAGGGPDDLVGYVGLQTSKGLGAILLVLHLY